MKRLNIVVLTGLLVLHSVGLWGHNLAFADDSIKNLPNYRANSFEVIQKVDTGTIEQTYKTLSSGNKHQFWEKYNETANNLGKQSNGTAKQLATGVMNWDTIIAYAANIIEWISNLGLVVGALFIIYSGYQYAMTAFGMKDDGGKAIKNAFIGIAVIATSYGIFRLLVRVFIE